MGAIRSTTPFAEPRATMIGRGKLELAPRLTPERRLAGIDQRMGATETSVNAHATSASLYEAM
ncbi:MAG: hypothetical protein QOE51_424 [Actinoplanes sp.]|nr:hypothetical protein [Actinoplanes sp.]